MATCFYLPAPRISENSLKKWAQHNYVTAHFPKGSSAWRRRYLRQVFAET